MKYDEKFCLDIEKKYPFFFKKMKMVQIPYGWRSSFVTMIEQMDQYIDSFEKLDFVWEQPSYGRPLGSPKKFTQEILGILELFEGHIFGVCNVCGSENDIVSTKNFSETRCKKHKDI